MLRPQNVTSVSFKENILQKKGEKNFSIQIWTKILEKYSILQSMKPYHTIVSNHTKIIFLEEAFWREYDVNLN